MTEPKIGERYTFADGHGILEIMPDRKMKVVVTWGASYCSEGDIGYWWPPGSINTNGELILLEGQEAPR